VEYLAGSVPSPPSILGGDSTPKACVIPFEGCHYTFRSLGNSHRLGKVIAEDLSVVARCEITKITVNTCGIDTFYLRRFPGDAETQAVRGKGEGANCDAWLGDDFDSMLGQG